MQDNTATLMIVRALQEIATEMRAIREELHHLNQLGRRVDPNPRDPTQDHVDLEGNSAPPIKSVR
jgi:hypothetical protein